MALCERAQIPGERAQGLGPLEGALAALDLARQRFERRPAERVVGTALRCGGEAGDDHARQYRT